LLADVYRRLILERFLADRLPKNKPRNDAKPLAPPRHSD
jgi:hypothetical protein